MENKKDKINLRTKISLRRHIIDMFNDTDDSISYAIAKKRKVVSIMDSAYIIRIDAKTDEAKKVIYDFIDVDNNKSNKPTNLSYMIDTFTDLEKETSAEFSVEYLKWIFKFFDILNEEICGSVFIKVRKDYPLTVEDKHFKIILAPRISGEKNGN